MVGQVLAYGIGAILFVLLPALLEPGDKFSAAVVFYGIGVLIVLFMIYESYSFGFWRLWPMIFPPLVTGLVSVAYVGRVWGYGSAAPIFSALPEVLSVPSRFWMVLRRVLIIPLALISVFAVLKLEPVIEDGLFALCPPGSYYEGNDSVPESCSDTRIQKLQALNNYAAVGAPLALVIFGATWLEPRHKRLAARLVWLVGSGFLGLLTPLAILPISNFLFWWQAVIAFFVGALCIWLIGRCCPDDLAGQPEHPH